jgi:hypothetical protein
MQIKNIDKKNANTVAKTGRSSKAKRQGKKKNVTYVAGSYLKPSFCVFFFYFSTKLKTIWL